MCIYKCMLNVYKNQQNRQDMGYLYEACDQILDFCHQQLLRKMRRKISWTDGRTDRWTEVKQYTPLPLRERGIISKYDPFFYILKVRRGCVRTIPSFLLLFYFMVSIVLNINLQIMYCVNYPSLMSHKNLRLKSEFCT